MATISKKPSGNWRVQIRRKGQTISRTFPSRADAATWAGEAERQVRGGDYVLQLANSTRLDGLALRYLGDMARRGLRDQRNLEQRINWWRAHYGRYALAEISPALVSSARDRLLRSGKSAGTVNRYIAALSSMLTAGIKRYNVLSDNPCFKVQREREHTDHGRALTIDEQRTLLDACADDAELHMAVALSLATAVRQGELCRVRWRDVDLSRRMLVVPHSKSGKPRSIALADHVVAELRTFAAVRNLHDDRVFVSPADNLYRRFRRALASTGIGALRWHDMRHSCLHRLACAGATLPELMSVSGHSTFAMVQRYAHLSQAAPRGAIDRAFGAG